MSSGNYDYPCSVFRTICYLALIVSYFSLILVKSTGWNEDFPLLVLFLRYFPPVIYASCGLLALSIPIPLLHAYSAASGRAEPSDCRGGFSDALRFLFHREEIRHLALAGITFLVIYIGCRENLLLYLLLFFMTFCSDSRKISAAIFFSHAFGILFVLNAYLSELARDDIYVFPYGTCHSLGFYNPNMLGLNLFITVLFGWYLWGAAHRRIFTAAGILLSAACFLVSGCRTAALCMLVLVLFSWLPEAPAAGKGSGTGGASPAAAGSESIKEAAVTCLPLIMLAASVLLGILLFPFDGNHDNTFLTRFTECVYAFRERGLHLFAEDYSTSLQQYYFDNGYINWVFRRGIIASAGFFSALLYASRRLARCGSGKLIRMFICVLLYYCMEGHMDMFFVPFLALCPDYRTAG